MVYYHPLNSIVALQELLTIKNLQQSKTKFLEFIFDKYKKFLIKQTITKSCWIEILKITMNLKANNEQNY